MTLHIPTLSDIMAVSQTRGADSDAPHLWDGLVGWWPLNEGGGSTAFDASGRGNGGSLLNIATSSWGITPYGRSLDGFKDYDDHITIASSPISAAPFTFSVWANVVNVEGGFGDFVLMCKDRADSEYLSLRQNGEARLHDDNGAKPISESTSVEGWHHWVTRCTSDSASGTIAVYKDSDELASSSMSGYVFDYSGMRDIGHGTSNDPDYCSRFSLCLHNRALAPSEIQQLYADPWVMGRRRPTVVAFSGGAAGTTVTPTILGTTWTPSTPAMKAKITPMAAGVNWSDIVPGTQVKVGQSVAGTVWSITTPSIASTTKPTVLGTLWSGISPSTVEKLGLTVAGTTWGVLTPTATVGKVRTPSIVGTQWSALTPSVQLSLVVPIAGTEWSIVVPDISLGAAADIRRCVTAHEFAAYMKLAHELSCHCETSVG